MSYSKTERNWLFLWLFLVNWVNSTFSRGTLQHCFLAFLLFLHWGKSGPSYFYSMFQAYLGTTLWRHSWGRNVVWEHFFEVCEGRNNWQYWLTEANSFILKKEWKIPYHIMLAIQNENSKFSFLKVMISL